MKLCSVQPFVAPVIELPVSQSRTSQRRLEIPGDVLISSGAKRSVMLSTEKKETVFFFFVNRSDAFRDFGIRGPLTLHGRCIDKDRLEFRSWTGKQKI